MSVEEQGCKGIMARYRMPRLFVCSPVDQQILLRLAELSHLDLDQHPLHDLDFPTVAVCPAEE